MTSRSLLNRTVGMFVAACLLPLAAVLADDVCRVWCVGESAKIRPHDTPVSSNMIWNAETRTVNLSGARNEYVGFQIAIRAEPADLTNVTLRASGLGAVAPGSGIPASCFELFLEHYLDVTVVSRSGAGQLFPGCTPGPHPAQMVPLDAPKRGAPFRVPTGACRTVWVDLYVPEDCPPGAYTGSVTVTEGGQTIARIRTVLAVWPFTLPQETHFRTYLYTGPENLRWAHRLPGDMADPAWAALEDRYFQMAHQHRLNFHPCAGSGREEVLTRYRRYYDGAGFTNRVGRGVGQTVACIGPDGETEDAVKASVRGIVQDYERSGLRALVFSYVWDEPHSDDDFARSKQRCKWIREASGGRLKTFIATPQWTRYDAGDVSIYSEPAIGDIAGIRARGDEVWAVNSGYGAGPYVDSPGYGGRSIAWMNWKLRLGGWQFWDCCYWVDRQNRKHREGGRWVRDMTKQQLDARPEVYLHDLWNDPLNFDETRKRGYNPDWAIRINGDGLLFYPGYDVGVNGPVASFAMKSLRRGAQDYEYLWLLRQRGREKEADAVVDSVCPAAGRWNDDPESWDRARLRLAELLLR